MKKYKEVSEYVSLGHPDKIADQISDAILDQALKENKDNKVAVEVAIDDRTVFVFEEVKYSISAPVDDLVLDILNELNVDSTRYEIINSIKSQSKEINHAVERHEQPGAGDQGFMKGFATNKNDEMIPNSYLISKRIIKALTNSYDKYIYRDAKAQVTMSDGEIEHITISLSHDENTSIKELENYIFSVIENDDWLRNIVKRETTTINPSGKFVISGLDSDSGLTGRKLIVDNYGGRIRHGGGAFSGKDGSKVDKTGALFARALAVCLVKQKIVDEIEIEVAFEIGNPKPVYISYVSPDENPDHEYIEHLLNSAKEKFDLEKIIKTFELDQPKHLENNRNGYFSNSHSWEDFDKISGLF